MVARPDRVASALYNREILRLAASTASLERLRNPVASAERRSPVCGSRVTIDLALDDTGRIAALGGEVRACAMGQASTALFAGHAVGLNRKDIAAARDALAHWLGGGPRDDALWDEFDVFTPAIAHSARHAAILLPFDAALAALDQKVDA